MAKSMMALLSIVESGKGKKLIKEIKLLGAKINFHTVGYGTAPTEMMDFLGLGSNDKDVIFSLGAESDIKNMIANFGDSFQSHSKYGGIMMIYDLDEWRLVNEVYTGIDTPDTICQDSEGNWWITGVSQS